MLYFDTSALLPYYRNEAASEAIETLLLGQEQAVLISELTEVELASALARWVRTGELDEPQAHKLEAAFRTDLQAGRWARQPLASTQFQLAREWITTRKTALRTLDGLHLACAQAHGACLVTLDETMRRAAAFFGLEVWDHHLIGTTR